MAIVALYIVNVIIAQKFGQDRKMPLSAPNSFLAFLILMSHASSTDFKVDSVCLVIATLTLLATSPTFRFTSWEINFGSSAKTDLSVGDKPTFISL